MNQPPQGSRRPGAPEFIAAVLILILAVVVIVSALTVFQLPEAITSQARNINRLYEVTLAISFVVFFGVTAGIIWACFRYRRRSADEMPVQIHGSNVLEMTWTAIPILILVILFIFSFVQVRDLKTPPEASEIDLEVVAVGHQWWWEFDYPSSGVKVQSTPPDYANLEPPHLVVPVGKTVRVTVKSTDVIHSFYAPHTLYKIQAIPGNVNQMHFKAEKVGLFHGQCYQFCGLRHADMLFVLDVRSQADYDRWLSDTKRAQGLTDNEPGKVAALGVPADATKNE